ncbi:hypothetical protein D3C85_1460170 [compost metagenome]
MNSPAYGLSEDAMSTLQLLRDSLRLLKNCAEDSQCKSTFEPMLMCSFLTLIDQQLSGVIDSTYGIKASVTKIK